MRKLFERIVDFMEENGSIQSKYRDIYLFALQTVAVYAFNIGTGVVIGAALPLQDVQNTITDIADPAVCQPFCLKLLLNLMQFSDSVLS